MLRIAWVGGAAVSVALMLSGCGGHKFERYDEVDCGGLKVSFKCHEVADDTELTFHCKDEVACKSAVAEKRKEDGNNESVPAPYCHDDPGAYKPNEYVYYPNKKCPDDRGDASSLCKYYVNATQESYKSCKGSSEEVF